MIYLVKDENGVVHEFDDLETAQALENEVLTKEKEREEAKATVLHQKFADKHLCMRIGRDEENKKTVVSISTLGEDSFEDEAEGMMYRAWGTPPVTAGRDQFSNFYCKRNWYLLKPNAREIRNILKSIAETDFSYEDVETSVHNLFVFGDDSFEVHLLLDNKTANILFPFKSSEESKGVSLDDILREVGLLR